MTVTIGSVPYLNARPLVKWFQTPAGIDSGITVVERPPSELAKLLEADEIDIALVSSFALFEHPEYSFVPGISISGQDEIRSVRAFSRIPFSKIESCAMDTSSLTSVAMLSILLAEVYHSYPQRISHAPDLQSMLDIADAALLIGDPGMLADGTGLHVLDLGDAWRRQFGLPFVYALWIGKPEKITDHIIQSLLTAKEFGQTQFEPIADEEAVRLNVSPETCLSYFNEVMDYGFDDEHSEALSLFRRKSQQYGLLTNSAQTTSTDFAYINGKL